MNKPEFTRDELAFIVQACESMASQARHSAAKHRDMVDDFEAVSENYQDVADKAMMMQHLGHYAIPEPQSYYEYRETASGEVMTRIINNGENDGRYLNETFDDFEDLPFD